MKLLNDRFVLDTAKPRIGGMAEVMRAVDTKNELSKVAVKFMTASPIHSDRIVREAFARELQALNTLEHQNIVRIIDFDPRHEPPYLVLEWVDRDLNTWLDTTTLADWDDFYSRIGRPVLDGLVYALTKRIVHRDLKPGNILIDDLGTPKIADFGISKFYDQGPGGLTLATFKSEPYAPFEESPFTEARDPYSFGVLALRCLSQSHFSNHEAVAAALTQFKGPPHIQTVLARALSARVEDRFRNVAELQSALETVDIPLGSPAATLRVCYVVIVPSAVQLLCERLGVDDLTKVRRRLQQEIAESCTFSFWKDKDGKRQDGHFHARTAQFRLHFRVSDRSADHLVLHTVWPDDSEVYGDFGLRAEFMFRFGQPPPGADGVPVMRWLVDAISQHELADADARRDKREEELFREWSNTLRFRQSLEERRSLPVDYDRYTVSGNRITFTTPRLPEGVSVEQPRLVRRDQRVVVSGLIDDVREDRLVLWIESGSADGLPKSGQLFIDDRAHRVAIDRQKNALDAVRYGRSLRPRLRTVILDPASSREPVAPQDIRWIQADFDDDKKTAVAKALGTEDILVVHGPPGTGKTRFITEFIAQLLQRDADCKILLTSQTHVALDNALERLHELCPTAKLLRIAQRDDDRVSTKVQGLTIDAVAGRWRSDVAKASEAFLASAAKDLGVKREDIALGIAAGRLRAESVELDEIERQLHEVEALLLAGEMKRAEADVAGVADAYHETEEALDEYLEQARELRERRKTVGARRRDAAKELAARGELGAQLAQSKTTDLTEWEDGLLRGSAADRKFHELIRLSEEWQLRFGRSREFYAAMVADSSVVAGTCLGFARIPGMLSAEFDVCIVDEASKATATEMLVPLVRAKRWVLVGDPKQLPPFVADLLDDRRLLKEHELDRASFETTLLDRFVAALPTACVASLTTQHRMIRPIGDLISECFYDGTLTSVRDEREPRLGVVLPAPVTWLTTARLLRREETAFNATFKNVTEAAVINIWLRRLDFIAKTSGLTFRVGVISGYFGQTTELTRTVAALQQSLSALTIECNTVDAFQGRECDICVYSVTRSNPVGRIGFLRDVRRLNVALSRGRSGLLIVGDHVFCRAARAPNPLRKVVEYIEDHPADCTIVEASE